MFKNTDLILTMKEKHIKQPRYDSCVFVRFPRNNLLKACLTLFVHFPSNPRRLTAGRAKKDTPISVKVAARSRPFQVMGYLSP